MSAILALAAALLLAADPPAPGAKAEASKPAVDPDQAVIDNLELLERLELLQNLDVLAPAAPPAAAPDKAPQEPAKEPPREKAPAPTRTAPGTGASSSPPPARAP